MVQHKHKTFVHTCTHNNLHFILPKQKCKIHHTVYIITVSEYVKIATSKLGSLNKRNQYTTGTFVGKHSHCI